MPPGLRSGAVVHAERRTRSERSLVATSHALATVRAGQDRSRAALLVGAIRPRPRPRDNGPTVLHATDGHTCGAIDLGPSRSTIQQEEYASSMTNGHRWRNSDGAELE
jgi:hypothetical protein